jgi:serine/threonine-protein kinase
VEAGFVVSATPASGEQAARDSEVVLVVSRGPEMVTVPDITGAESLSDAVRILEDAGLVAGDVQGPATGRPAGTDPEAGTEVRKGSEVDIILRRSDGGDG